MKFENDNNFGEITWIEYISYMILRTMRFRWCAIESCRRLLRTRMCDGLMQAIMLLFIEGSLLCAFLAVYDYAPEVDAGKRQNSFAPHLNGESNSLPVSYTCKFKMFSKTVRKRTLEALRASSKELL